MAECIHGELPEECEQKVPITDRGDSGDPSWGEII